MKTNFTTTRNLTGEYDFDGAEFSILNSQHVINYFPQNGYKKSTLQTSILYFLSIISIGSWLISLAVFPFGDVFQFLLGAIVLLINAYIFKYC